MLAPMPSIIKMVILLKGVCISPEDAGIALNIHVKKAV
jgi:hypothetical protein